MSLVLGLFLILKLQLK